MTNLDDKFDEALFQIRVQDVAAAVKKIDGIANGLMHLFPHRDWRLAGEDDLAGSTCVMSSDFVLSLLQLTFGNIGANAWRYRTVFDTATGNISLPKIEAEVRRLLTQE